MSSEHFLVTGAYGCIGTWVVRQLVQENAAVTAFDLASEGHRWGLVMTPDEAQSVERVSADISDITALERALDGGGVTHVIHLAALQIPFCRADPPLGARTNVLGTVNVFEAVKRRADRIHQVVYASSIAAYDAIDEGGRRPTARRFPTPCTASTSGPTRAPRTCTGTRTSWPASAFGRTPCTARGGIRG